MTNIYLPAELLQNYTTDKSVVSQSCLQNSERISNCCLGSLSSARLLGCRSGKSVCVTDLIAPRDGEVSFGEFNEGRDIRCEVVARIYFEHPSGRQSGGDEEKGFLRLKQVKVCEQELYVGVVEVGVGSEREKVEQEMGKNGEKRKRGERGETCGKEGVVVVYSREQFDKSVLLTLHDNNFTNVIDFIGNSLRSSRLFWKERRKRAGGREGEGKEKGGEKEDKLNLFFLLFYFVSLKILFLHSTFISFFSKLL